MKRTIGLPYLLLSYLIIIIVFIFIIGKHKEARKCACFPSFHNIFMVVFYYTNIKDKTKVIIKMSAYVLKRKMGLLQVVNFINILCTHFSYKHCFGSGSFSLVTCT